MISHHRHSLRQMQSRHTSWPLLGMMVLVLGVLLMQITSASLAEPGPSSGSLGLQGVMIGEPPVTAPQILEPLGGTVFDALPISVRGSCTGGLVVEVFKNDVLAGATSCQMNGSFGLMIDLFIGRNDLVARQYDQFNQASPNSAIVTVIYNPPSVVTQPVPQPTLKPGQKATTPVPVKIDQLIIKSDTAFKGVNEGGLLDWPVEIVGGAGPYAVVYEWGDGETSLLSLGASGRISPKHAYTKSGNYKILIKATDANGQQAMIQVLALVNGGAVATTTEKDIDAGSLLIAWPLFVVLVLMLGCFWLGERYEEQKLNRDFELGL